jgi:excisionase family DNA binding protein
MRNPKTASVAEIAAHWRMTTDTVRKILKPAGIRPASTGPERYRWTEVWSREGTDWVAPADEAAFKAPLRKATELGDLFPNVPARTITDWAKKKKIPAIRLGSDWRFREVTLKRWQDHG